MIHEKFGDLFKEKDDVIIHGCNCFNTMGAGVAKIVKQKYPEAYRIDQQTRRGDRNKLGTYTAWTGTHHSYDQDITVVNAYTQYRYGRGVINVDYDSIGEVMNLIKEDYEDKQYMGMPKIGAGLGGGDWNKIWKILKNIFGDNNQIVTVWFLK